MADIKRTLWEVDRRNKGMQSHLTQSHSNFANKILLLKKDEEYNVLSQKMEEQRQSLTQTGTYHKERRMDLQF